MALTFSIRTALLGAMAAAFLPAACPAAQLNVTSVTPVRPQIYLGPSLNMDVRSRTVYDLDASRNCRADERFRKGKRERRCRQDR